MKQKLLLVLLMFVSLSIGILVYQKHTHDFTTLSNESYKIDDFSGDFLVINYFAEWCAPCLKEVPELNKFHEQKPGNIHLFAINYDNLSTEDLTAIKEKYAMKFPLIKSVNRSFPITTPAYLPATYIIKPNGNIQGPLLGEQTADSLNSYLSID